MDSFVIYLLDSRSDTFTNLRVMPTTEQGARGTAAGSDEVVFKNGLPWRYLDNHGASYAISEE
jgi:hypothetical protein